MGALEIIDQVPEFARLIALELRKNESPSKDLVSTTKAYELYGRAWVDRNAKKGLIKPTYRGNKKMYSISEMERIVAKENTAARLLESKRV
jgi:hypothetical protein